MTVEIAIMNKRAAALAPDSAVTFQEEKGQKIFISANKVFALSKHHPVSVMVYGSAEFMEVPRETIIKVYRSHRGKMDFPTVGEYDRDSVTFFTRSRVLFPQTV
jgi:hypothetical protein